jgi:hypothetical protein
MVCLLLVGRVFSFAGSLVCCGRLWMSASLPLQSKIVVTSLLASAMPATTIVSSTFQSHCTMSS